MAVCKWTDGSCLLLLTAPCGACDKEELSREAIVAIQEAHESAAE